MKLQDVDGRACTVAALLLLGCWFVLLDLMHGDWQGAIVDALLCRVGIWGAVHL